MKYKQTGKNEKYPNEILIWNVDNDNIPEWIVDRCKVKNITDDGKIILEKRNTTTGGFEFISSTNHILFTTKTKQDYACFDPITKKIFVLTKTQLDLLYEKERD